ncbi:MAG: N-acetyl sugar amidotransferase [Bacteroidetes bacterium]|nr:N-acetyl sugar amidotransferase [Bacteroidota bacterium]
MEYKKYQQCERCVMDTSDPKIAFDQNGNCNHCNEFLNKRNQHKYQGSQSDALFLSTIEKIKKDGVGRKYDCILGVSGGIDSTYAAYLAKQQGLRILAVHLDNGWNSEEAVQNIKQIVQLLDIDYESYVLDWIEFRKIQGAFLKASIPEIETPTDIAIAGAMHQVAAKHGVKYIISGGNFATEGILPASWHYNAKDLKYFNHILSNFGDKKLSSFPTFGYLSEMYHKFIKGIKIIYLLNKVDYQKDQAIEFLKSELGWKYYGGKHYESKYTGFIQSYVLFEKFNIDYRRATFSSQICIGEMTREQALEELKNLPYNPGTIKEEQAYICKKLNISMEEFEAILAEKPHWYTHYPNDEKRLAFIYDTYRKIFKKEKLASF